METKDLMVGKIMITVPGHYQLLKAMPGDPEGAVPLAFSTDRAMCFVMMYPIGPEYAMPFDIPQDVIDGIHESMYEDQGLIEVDSGNTKAGNKYIESIVKTVKKEGGAAYTFTFHGKFPDGVAAVQGFFEEAGITGERDTIVFEIARRENLVQIDDDGFTGWSKDPYDPGYLKGIPKNLSEDERFDEMFPTHPLSQLRAFKKILIEEN